MVEEHVGILACQVLLEVFLSRTFWYFRSLNDCLDVLYPLCPSRAAPFPEWNGVGERSAPDDAIVVLAVVEETTVPCRLSGQRSLAWEMEVAFRLAFRIVPDADRRGVGLVSHEWSFELGHCICA